MKKTLITLAFAAASLPMFAAQTAPANPPAAGQTDSKTATTKPKKAKKAKVKKSKKDSTTGTTAPASK